ncbi:hypothetical protein FRC18_012400 [Serendipita sp. 400]|nr:hypothetical protein FRC18_012400 [Serendipita sp. 400]
MEVEMKPRHDVVNGGDSQGEDEQERVEHGRMRHKKAELIAAKPVERHDQRHIELELMKQEEWEYMHQKEAESLEREWEVRRMEEQQLLREEETRLEQEWKGRRMEEERLYREAEEERLKQVWEERQMEEERLYQEILEQEWEQRRMEAERLYREAEEERYQMEEERFLLEEAEGLKLEWAERHWKPRDSLLELIKRMEGFKGKMEMRDIRKEGQPSRWITSQEIMTDGLRAIRSIFDEWDILLE